MYPDNGGFNVPLTAASTAMWEASSADEWAALAAQATLSHQAPPYLHVGPTVPSLFPSLAGSLASRPYFDRTIILAAEALRIPPVSHSPSPAFSPPQPQPQQISLRGQRSQRGGNGGASQTGTGSGDDPATASCLALVASFPDCPVADAYAALRHTPLLELLAVSGDTWVFAQKVVSRTSFLEHKRRLKAWTARRHAVVATVMAARCIAGFLRLGRQDAGDGGLDHMGQAGAAVVGDISDYWAVYTSALIIWAAAVYRDRRTTGDATTAAAGSGSPPQPQAHHYHPYSQRQRRRQPAGGRSQGGNHVVGEDGGDDEDEDDDHVQGDGDDNDSATWWLLRVAALATESIDEGTAWRYKPGAKAVLRFVRRWLQDEAAGSRCGLLNDAVTNLRNLDEREAWPWF